MRYFRLIHVADVVDVVFVDIVPWFMVHGAHLVLDVTNQQTNSCFLHGSRRLDFTVIN